MFNKTMITAAVAAIALALSVPAFGQKKQEAEENSVAPKAIKIDGELSEWGDRFTVNEQTKLYYIISNDTKNLYLSIRCSDKQKISKILTGGISLMVNPEGKKKDGPSVTFPVIQRGRTQGTTGRRDLDQAIRDRVASAREIRVKDLKSIPDGGIAVDNEYGIKAAATYDNNNSLSYELAVPLDQLNLSDVTSKIFSANIRLNGLPAPQRMTGGGRSPYDSRMGGYNRPASLPPVYQSEDFWIKRFLTNNK